MNVMNSFMTHFAASEAEIVADESTGFASAITAGDEPMNYWVLFVRGVAHNVWTDAITGEVVQSFPERLAA
jgi:hypothetical protein